MLEKIHDINSNLNYKKENNNIIHSSNVGNYTVKGNLNDTITFSSAALFLNNINWQLKELKINESDLLGVATGKINIKFIVDNIEFKTEIDLLNRNNNDYQKYEVTKNYEEINEIKNSTVFVSINLNEISIIKSIDYELKTFHILFNRIFDYVMENGLNYEKKDELIDNKIIKDDYSLQLITDGLMPSLALELSSITNLLFEFIKRLGYKITLPDYQNKNNNELLIIEKIFFK
ncbi:MAG: hypothetical protein STSR0008_15620 [Ignavibacterium sp.]